MSYERQLENIWLRLQDPGAPDPRHAVTTRFAFDDICAAFLQAEMGPEIDERGKRVWGEKGVTSDAIRTYRAEWNIWAYYYGEHDPFPGLDPALPIPEQNLFTDSRRTDSYVPDYAVPRPDRDMQDIGPALRGSVYDKQSIAVERGRMAIERREREAEKFMKYREHKNNMRRRRKVERERSGMMEGRSEGREPGGRDEEAREHEGGEWMENYGHGGDEYQEPALSHGGREEYQRSAENYSRLEKVYQEPMAHRGGVEKDEMASTHRTRMRGRQRSKRAMEKIELLMLREQVRKRSMSPSRDGAGGEWRGDVFRARDMRDCRGRGYEVAGSDERKRQEDNRRAGREGGRGLEYANVGNYDRQNRTRESIRSERGPDRLDNTGSGHFRDSGKTLGWAYKEGRVERTRRDDNADRGYARRPPSLRREDAVRFVEDETDFDRTSKWVQDGGERVKDGYQIEGYEEVRPYPRYQTTVESAAEGRRDRGFGILKDAKEYYKEACLFLG
ncbi:hypothetical protein BKA65DRAFT_519189 [Rhexocercosporidium sp. MPI-PUGE-AT-0058]|nr:hypothetical protein BKA65DRAFT_519189 [Rhexocercosporidium sp. MPI-PUGE-AT-0058]